MQGDRHLPVVSALFRVSVLRRIKASAVLLQYHCGLIVSPRPVLQGDFESQIDARRTWIRSQPSCEPSQLYTSHRLCARNMGESQGSASHPCEPRRIRWLKAFSTYAEQAERVEWQLDRGGCSQNARELVDRARPGIPGLPWLTTIGLRRRYKGDHSCSRTGLMTRRYSQKIGHRSCG